MNIDISTHKCFDDIANFITCFVSLTLTYESYKSGSTSPYEVNHSIGLLCKQNGINIVIYPSNMLNTFFRNDTWPTSFELITRQDKIPPPEATMKLGNLEKPIYALGASMFINYYEKQHIKVNQMYSEKSDCWPEDWRFARVIRGAFAHGGSLAMQQNDRRVSWQSLTYRPRDSGKKPYPSNDLWPGDLIYLLMDLDRHMP